MSSREDSERGTLVNRRGVVIDDWFERSERMPMTMAPIRSLVLAILAPLEGARILEVGCGIGAMTVELLRAVGKKGHVTSLEPTALVASVAQRNIDRSGLGARVKLITGNAPKHIPQEAFSVAFIGGNCSDLESIMGTCWERLEVGGRLLLAAFAPDTAARALSYLAGLGVEADFWRVQAATGRRMGNDWQLQGNPPVDLIWGDK